MKKMFSFKRGAGVTALMLAAVLMFSGCGAKNTASNGSDYGSEESQGQMISGEENQSQVSGGNNSAAQAANSSKSFKRRYPNQRQHHLWFKPVRQHSAKR